MPDPTPTPPATTLVPTAGSITGAVAGGAVAQLLVFGAGRLGVTLDPATIAAVTTLCVFGAGYFHSDSRKDAAA